MPETTPGAGKRKLGLRFLAKLYDYLGGQFWVVSAIVLVAAILDGASLLMLAPLLAAATGQSDNEWWMLADRALVELGATTPDAKLVVAIGLFGAVLLLRSALMWLRDVRMAQTNQAFVDHLRLELVGLLALSPWQRMPASRRSDIEHAIHSDMMRVQSGSNQALRAAGSLSLALAQAIAAFLVSWQLALVSLGSLLIVAIAMLPGILASSRLGSESTIFGRNAHNLLSAFLAGLKLYKAHGLERAFVAEYAAALKALRTRTIIFAGTIARSRFLGTLAAGAVLASLILLGVLWLDLTVAVLGVFIVIFGRLSRLCFQFVQNAQSFLHMLPAFAHLMELHDRLGAEADRSPAEGHMDPAPRAARQSKALSIAVTNLSYAFEQGAEPLLRDLSFEVAAGDVVAVVGPSGSGKTTLIDLVTGLARPRSGTIALGGTEIQDDFPAELRRRIAYVPQEMVFFDGNLRDNLQSLSGRRDDAALWDALRMVEADRIPAVLNGGLDTRVGELGQRFSGGERQRIGLARALLREPDLLVLDEALSALDPALEERLLRMLLGLRGSMTILIVAHRLSPALRLDQKMRLRGGSIAPEVTSALVRAP